MLVCSALAHYGDVYTMTMVQPDVLCTSGSDGQVRLLEMKSNNSPVKTPTSKLTAALPHDELVYRQISNGVMSIRQVGLMSDISSCYLLICLSSVSAPQLVHIRHAVDVHQLNLPQNMDIGN